MKAYLVGLVDPETQVRQRIWVKSQAPVTLGEMCSYVSGLDGLRVNDPRIISFREKSLPSTIRQELVEKAFQVFVK